MRKVLAIAALLGSVGMNTAVYAAPGAATMVSVGSYSKSATTLSNWTVVAGNTATFTFDSATNNLVVSGVYKRVVKVGATPLMTHTMSGVTIGSGAATGASWSCTEGAFGGIVGASICGNYSFGNNATNDSVYTPVGTGATVAIGGDDAALAGGPQTLANNYSFMNAATMIGGAAPGFQRWVLNNGLDLFPGAGETGTGLDTGYKFTFDAAPPPPTDAVDDGPVDVVESIATPITVGVNDVGFNSPVMALVTTNPTKGMATVTSAPGSVASQVITYTANTGQSGSDSFVYTVDDGVNFDSARVTVHIIALAANNDMAATTRGQPVVIAAGTNDVVFDDTVYVTVANSGICDQGGMAAVTAGQGGSAAGIRVTYTPAATAPGSGAYTETCTYSIDDGVRTSFADIVIAVSNSVPVANDGDGSIGTVGVTPLGQTAGFTAPGAGGNLGDSPAVVTVTTPGTKGTASVSGRVITYAVTDAAFFTGTDTYTYTVTDLDGETDTGVVTIAISDRATAIADGAIITDMNTASAAFAPLVTLGNGSAAQHTMAVTTNGVHGSCVVSPANATGRVTYRPDAGYIGYDSCVLTLTDGDGDADTAIIQISVKGDADHDGIEDGVDNCLGAANPGQQDTDGDGFGNWCDADFNNDGRVNFADLAEFRSKFGSTDAKTNLDSMGLVNFADLARFKALFGKPPGPSGQVP